jgi:hypothetical protein
LYSNWEIVLLLNGSNRKISELGFKACSIGWMAASNQTTTLGCWRSSRRTHRIIGVQTVVEEEEEQGRAASAETWKYAGFISH